MTRRSLRRAAPVVALLMATLAAAPARGASAAAPHPARSARKPPPLKPVTAPAYTALPEETSLVPTRGGAVLARIIRPNVPAGARVPVILTFTPYSAIGGSAADGLATFFVPRGYARVVADVPGTGDSGGCWDYGGKLERSSGVDLVEWLGTRAWSNGKVGMIGGSYDGTTANMVAADNAPHLATIVPEVSISQWYGYAYHQGLRYFVMDPVQRQGAVIDEQGFDTPGGFDLGFALAPPMNTQDTDWSGRTEARLCPDVKAEHLQRGYSPEPDFDTFWSDRDYLAGARNLARRDGQEIPALVVGGWQDYNVKHSESTQWFRAIPADNRKTRKDEGVPQKMLIMDQVSHGLPVTAGIDFETILHAWFDHYLWGLPTNIDKQPGSLSVTEDGVLHADASWPPPGTKDAQIALLAPSNAARAGAPSLRADVRAGPAVPGTTTIGSYLDLPVTDESMALALKGDGQLLWFQSPPLKHAIRIAGTPRLQITATSSETSTHYTPVLFDLGTHTDTRAQCDFVPSADACVITRGFLNARYRDGLPKGADLPPNQPYSASIRFIDNDWVIPAGHSFALAIMSSNRWWALPDQARSTNAILEPSSLFLPVVGGIRALASAF